MTGTATDDEPDDNEAEDSGAEDNQAGDDGAVIRKRSVLIAGHATSVSLEAAFWDGLRRIAASRGQSVNRIVAEIDRTRSANLSSAIRLFVLRHPGPS